ncbi:CaiB/BaiF CoA transferase family protein [Piscinibacterium candidicorallinum]|uniref:CaiB/BaiF CoA transferase family protein n=1 Tax=Piscinibacterium candidicorallinum TaxID=1793872 RepID=A0ABV7H2E9_9BURK
MSASPSRAEPGAAAMAGVRVLDLSRVLAGPWCTQTLADLGADVIKIERPGAGDDTRAWGPPFMNAHDGEPTRESAYYLGTNRNKRSVTVDIAQPEGQALLRELAQQCDVFVENFKVGDMARYGLDYARLAVLNPRIVYCSITGFGQTGPYKDRAGYDYAIQGMGGLMSVTGERDDLPGGGPQKVGVAVADLFTGLYSTIGILAALRHAQTTGQGQHLDMALLDCQVAMLANLSANYLVSGKTPQRMGNAHPNIVPYQVFEASDGFLILAVGNDSQFAKFCEVAGLPDLPKDARFATNAARVQHREVLVPMLVERFRMRSRAQWLDALEAAKVPAGPINNLAEVFADPQVQHRGLAQVVEHPDRPAQQLVTSPIRLSATPTTQRRAPPRLGEHTDQVLAEFGLTPDRVASLRAAGVLG